jgi:hypothetical protein
MVHCSTRKQVLRRENRSDYPKWYQIGHNMPGRIVSKHFAIILHTVTISPHSRCSLSLRPIPRESHLAGFQTCPFGFFDIVNPFQRFRQWLWLLCNAVHLRLCFGTLSGIASALAATLKTAKALKDWPHASDVLG